MSKLEKISNCKCEIFLPFMSKYWACSTLSHDLFELEIVMNEMQKNKKFHFDLQIHPTLLNSTCLHCQMTGFIPIRVQNFQNVE